MAGARFALLSSTSLYVCGDCGAYLVGLRQLTGEGASDADFTRLPFGPGWLLWPFVEVLGVKAGLNLFNAVSSVALLVPAVYLFIRPWAAPNAAAAVAIAAALSPHVILQSVAGSLVLIGLPFLLVAMWAVYRIATSLRRYGDESDGELPGRVFPWEHVALALSLPAMAFTNHSTVLIALLSLPVWTVWAVWTSPAGWRSASRALALPVAAGLLLSTPALPQYLAMLAYPRFSYEDGGFGLAPDGYIRWASLLGAASLAVIALYGRHSPVLRGLSVLIALHSLATLFSFPNEIAMNVVWRSAVWVAILSACGVGLVLVEHWTELRHRLAAPALAVVMCGMALLTHYDVEQNLVAALQEEYRQALDSLPPEHGVVLTQQWSYGTWTQGLIGAPVRWHRDEHQPPLDTDCLFGWAPCDDPGAAAAAAGVTHVVVETSWPVPPYAMHGAPKTNPWAALLSGELTHLRPAGRFGTVHVWEVSDA